MDNLKIQSFGPIKDVDIDFGDLTFFVGPQASGKSISLEVFKLLLDKDSILTILEDYGYVLDNDSVRILNAYFGDGMDKLWKKDKTKISIDRKRLTLTDLKKKGEGKESTVLYVPAQRVICMEGGYPKNFKDFDAGTPFVIREFSEVIRSFMQYGISDKKVFPFKENSKNVQTESLDDSIFHHGKVKLSDVLGRKKLTLDIDGLTIPFMAWSAGQKEFMPLLLAFYCLAVAPSKLLRKEKFSIVIIEEPEMGLHPKAIESVLLQILELIRQGYKVIVSTHSTLFLEFAWAFNTIKDNEGNVIEGIVNLFESKDKESLRKTIEKIKDKIVKTYFFKRTSRDKIVTKDISSLDVMSEEVDLSEWGGIMDFSTRSNEVVSRFS